MFSIYDGRESFYQWDLDRKLIVADDSINQVHFCNKTDDCSLVCEVYTENGKRLVNVPNILLQTDWKIRVYGYDTNYTKHYATFGVVARTKPTDYVYTETEVKNWEELEERITELEENGGSGSCVDLTKEQNLTEEQQLQARMNIAAVSIDDLYTVSSQHINYVHEQNLTETEKERARNNIGAISANVAATKKYVDDLIGGIENGSY